MQKKSSHGEMELTVFPYKVGDYGQRNRAFSEGK